MQPQRRNIPDSPNAGLSRREVRLSAAQWQHRLLSMLALAFCLTLSLKSFGTGPAAGQVISLDLLGLSVLGGLVFLAGLAYLYRRTRL